MTNKQGTVFNGALLVAGTSIGGGMLALPIETGLSGFFPSVLVYFLCWGLMTCTGLLFLEVALSMKKESNIVTMAEQTLGIGGKIFSWCLYLFLFYSLTLAYISGCGNLLAQAFPSIIPAKWGPFLFVLFFGPMIYAGTRIVGKVNAVMMIGLAISYLTFVVLGAPNVKVEKLLETDWSLALMGLPVAFTAFAYQGIIPTLVNYMGHDEKKTRKAIIIGSSIPFLTYIVWQALILGIVPRFGPGSLAEALSNNDNAVHPLRNFLHNPSVYIVGQYFAFFALVTSFFGVTLGLFDFLADGLKIEKTPVGKIVLSGIVFVPPLIVSLYNPNLFLVALNYAGGFGCALLLGLLPILMVWKRRYVKGMHTSYALPGGKVLLACLATFVVFEVLTNVYFLLT